MDISLWDQEDLLGLHPPLMETVAVMQLDQSQVALIRADPTMHIAKPVFDMLTEELKQAGGTFWFPSRIWLVDLARLGELKAAISLRLESM